MDTGTALQVLFVVQIFILGGLVALLAQYWRRHRAAGGHRAELEHYHYTPGQDGLPDEVKHRLIEESELKIQNSINHTAEVLEHDLDAATNQINQMVNKLGADIVAGEMDRYRKHLDELHQQTTRQMGELSGEVAKHEQAVKVRIEQELAAEKQRLVKQIDTKLGDAVASFLNETLQHNVDLGGQSDYLIAMLEQHKADFIKEVGADETKA